MVFMFGAYRKKMDVQRELVKLLNNHCAELDRLQDGPRDDGRINLTIAVRVVPWGHTRPNVELAFAATTRELSSRGLSIVVDQPITCETVALGWTWEGEMRFARGKVRHQDPIGAGFWNVGIKLVELVLTDDWPELRELKI